MRLVTASNRLRLRVPHILLRPLFHTFRSPINNCRCLTQRRRCSTGSTQTENERVDDDKSRNDSNDNNANAHVEYNEIPTLPCYLTKFDAMESFNEWAKKQFWCPSQLKKEPASYIHSVSRYFAPFWHFEAAARSKAYASIREEESEMSDDKAYLWEERKSSCYYASSMPQMQVAGHISETLTEKENDFLEIPFGESQFQRMQHHKDDSDVLPITVTKGQATKKVFDYLKQQEHKRMTGLIKAEKLHHPKFETHIEHTVRMAYIPCFIVEYSVSVKSETGNSFDKPNMDLSTAAGRQRSSKLRRAIVNGSCGSIIGQRLFSMRKCSIVLAATTTPFILPMGLLLLYPLTHTALTIGLCSASVAFMLRWHTTTRARLFKLKGNQQNTSQANFWRRQMEEKMTQDTIDNADNAWMGYSSRSRPVRRQHEMRREDTYRRFHGMDEKEEERKSSSGQERHDSYYEAFDYEKAYGDGKTSGSRPNVGSTKRVVKHTELYEVLGVAPNASLKDIQASFTELAKMFHPDVLEHCEDKEKKEGGAKFEKVLTAFQVLKDPQKRQVYDETGEIGKKRGAGAKSTQQQKYENSKKKPSTSGTKRTDFNRGV